MRFARSAGVLLHPTSLPGFGGIGSLGRNAFAFVDALVQAGVGLWQVLPLGPTGYGDSPYSSFSSFAGNPLLIDLEDLREQGLLDWADLQPLEALPETRVDFGRVVPGKYAVLRAAFDRWSAAGGGEDEGFALFRRENAVWLPDFALFMALKDEHAGAAWGEWDTALRRREPDALQAAASRLAADVRFHEFLQLVFRRQWDALKRYANEHGVQVVGDIPIFLAYDSADVWAHQELFQLDEDGVQTVAAGVPPDYFSETGQLWGNPHYRWDRMAQTGFAWWIERFRSVLRLVDIIRLDHFRGFAAAWAVPFGDETAVRGEWVPGPGAPLFQAILDALGPVPIIAEDLGYITPDVHALREAFGFPGMKILQFAFSTGPTDASLPHNYDRNTVVYTGTHDNDTTVGWFSQAPEEERAYLLRYVGSQGTDVAWDLIRLAIASPADLAIVPLQDVLRLGTAARMNAPGRAEGNWGWRYTEGEITQVDLASLRFLNETYGRVRDGAPANS